VIVLNSRVVRIAVASVLSGLLIGIVGGGFQRLLTVADSLRGALILRAHAWPHFGWLVPVALGLVGAALARLLVVHFSPEAEGSGVQRVEAFYRGDITPATIAVLPVKFFGGILAMGCGLALGREGPTVQMGSTLAAVVSRFLLKRDDETKMVDAAGAGAGLAVAFNAPMSGAIFVFEELTTSFNPYLLVAATGAATIAVVVLRGVFGDQFDFVVKQVSPTTIWRMWPFAVLGMLIGVVGALYNRIIILLLRISDRSVKLNSVQRAAVIGAVIGILAWFAPTLVGGGDNLTQAILSSSLTLRALAGIFVLRFFVGPFSYAAGAPGGLFAPMLVLGASFGALFGELMSRFDPGLGVTPLACAVIGMGTLFSACVRAPLTGAVLTVEMTGRGDLTLALLGASMVAIVVAMLLESKPIYESLTRRMIEQQTAAKKKTQVTLVSPTPETDIQADRAP
jgi:chloride channel protein, CIC family